MTNKETGNQGDRSRDSLKMSDHGPVPIDCSEEV